MSGIRTLAGIVLYEPDIERLKENISAVADQVDGIVLVDNGSGNISDVKNSISTEVEYIENKCNLGIATALNQIFAYAEERGYEWVLTLDQDPVCRPGLVDEYMKFISLPDAGMLTCRITDRNCYSDALEYEQDSPYIEVKQCITTGSFCSVDAYRHTSGFDERLFIDFVDYDYNAKLRTAGYKIYRMNYDGVLHEIGHSRNVHWTKGRTAVVSNHSAFRQYYIARNRLYVARKYPSEFDYKDQWKSLIKSMILIILHEDDKWNKIKNIIRGIRDSKKLTREDNIGRQR